MRSVVGQGTAGVRWGVSLGLLALAGLGSATARADLIVTLDGQQQVVDAHQVLIVYTPGTEVLVEQLRVRSTTPRSLWLKAFDQRPQLEPVAEAPFDAVAAGTAVGEPYHRQVRSHVFGPSVVTLLTQKLLPEDSRPRQEVEDTEDPRSLRVEAQEVFTGTVYTSTITHTFVLPDAMQAWLRMQGFELTEAVKASLAGHLNVGAHVMATVLSDSAPTPDSQALIGPFQVRLETDSPTYPSFRRAGAPIDSARYDFYVVGPQALVPTQYPTLWNEEAWTPPMGQRAQFETRYAQAQDPNSPIALDLVQRQELPVPDGAVVLYSRFRPGPEVVGDIPFEPRPDFVEIPGRTGQGSLLDMFLCLLLGLTPLIYTPESWFLLWLGARARDRIRQGELALGHWLWPVYALVVAGFWLFAGTGAARAAAALPLLVAVFRLGLPERPQALSRVRVEFKKKKKAR